MSPRRQRGEGSISKRKDGLWVGRIDLGYRDGKRRRKAVYGRTQREVVRKLAEANRAKEAGDLNTAGITVAKWLDYWIDHVCPGKPAMKPKTLRNYRSYVDTHLVPSLGGKRLDRLTAADVRGLHRDITDPKRRGLSSTTAHHAHRILHTALNDAVREGRVTRNVASLVPAPPKAAVVHDALTLDQFATVMRGLDGDRLQSRWAFGLFTGARQGECLGLTWQHVDLDGGVADLAWQLQRIPYRHGCTDPSICRSRADRCPFRELAVQPGFDYRHLDGNLCLQRPKTKGSTRLVPIPEPLLTAMRERHALYLDERRRYTRDHGLVWARENGRPIDGRADWSQWRGILARHDLPPLTLHSQRHTANTVLLALGVEESVRMSIMGHSEAATNRLYAHASLDVKRKAMDAYGAAVATLLAPTSPPPISST